jgi:hypothetical protein
MQPRTTPTGRTDRVCAECIDDEDLQEWIRADDDEDRGCDFCGCEDAPTVGLEYLGEHIRTLIEDSYSYAGDELPYEGAEGGFQGVHWTTYEVLFEQIGLSLPRDSHDLLAQHLADAVSDQLWCEYEWTRLDIDDALELSWDEFSDTIKHRRRFFFAGDPIDPEDADAELLDPIGLLNAISRLLEGSNVIRTIPAGTAFYRARGDDGAGPYDSPAALGPPPPAIAIQSNRMNPPGIPMMYVAESADLAVAEVRTDAAWVGTFQLLRESRILDLAEIPFPPGIFSGEDRAVRLTRVFLHQFERAIMQPVPRDDRVHVEYIPSQVVTEFFREHGAGGGPIDGIRYRSSFGNPKNLVFFATHENIRGAVSEPSFFPREEWFKLLSVERRSLHPPGS